MLGYSASTYFQDLYVKIKFDMHYTDKQMYKNFPCLLEKCEKERLKNLTIKSNLEMKKIIKKSK